MPTDRPEACNSSVAIRATEPLPLVPVTCTTGNARCGSPSTPTSRSIRCRDPNLPRGERTPARAFRTECAQPPSASTNRIGTSGVDDLYGPGYLNWDITVAKNVPFGGGRRVQFRAELYNAFNNVQFATVNTTAQFNAAGEQINPEFGPYTAARDARRIQLTLRVDF